VCISVFFLCERGRKQTQGWGGWGRGECRCVLTGATPAALWVIKRGEAWLLITCSGKMISELQGSLNQDQDSSPGPPWSSAPTGVRVSWKMCRWLEVISQCLNLTVWIFFWASPTVSAFSLNKSQTVFSPRATRNRKKIHKNQRNSHSEGTN